MTQDEAKEEFKLLPEVVSIEEMWKRRNDRIQRELVGYYRGMFESILQSKRHYTADEVPSRRQRK